MCMGVGLLFVLVLRRPCFVCLRWPLKVAIAFGKCLFTSCDVKPGHDAKYPASMALHHVDTVGLNAAAWRKLMRFGSVFIW